MDVKLHIKQAIGHGYIIRINGNIEQISPNSIIHQQDVITVPYHQKAWIITHKLQQLDLLDSSFIFSDNKLISITLPQDLIHAIQFFISRIQNQTIATSEQAQQEKNPLLQELQDVYIAAGLTKAQSQTLVTFRHGSFFNHNPCDPPLSVIPVPITQDTDAYYGRIVALIQLGHSDPSRYILSIPSQPQRNFFQITRNLITLSKIGASALTSSVFSQNEIRLTLHAKSNDEHLEKTIQIPFISSIPESQVHSNPSQSGTQIVQEQIVSDTEHAQNQNHSDQDAKTTTSKIKNTENQSFEQKPAELSTNPLLKKNSQQAVKRSKKVDKESFSIKYLSISEEQIKTQMLTLTQMPPTVLTWRQVPYTPQSQSTNPSLEDPSACFTIQGQLPNNIHFRIRDSMQFSTLRGHCILKPNRQWIYTSQDPTQCFAALDEGDICKESIPFHQKNKICFQLVIVVTKQNNQIKVNQVNIEDLDTHGQAYQAHGKLIPPKAIQTNNDIKANYRGKYGQIDVRANGDWQYQIFAKLNYGLTLLFADEIILERLTIQGFNQQSIEVIIAIYSDEFMQIKLLPTCVLDDQTRYITGKFIGRKNNPHHVIQGKWGKFTLFNDGGWQYLFTETKQIAHCHSLDTISESLYLSEAHQSLTLHIQYRQNELLFHDIQLDKHTDKEDAELILKATASLPFYSQTKRYFDDGIYTGTFGQLHLSMQGQWEYKFNEAHLSQVQALEIGKSLTDMITIYSYDGYPIQITIALTATEEHPILSGHFSANLDPIEENPVVTATGQLNLPSPQLTEKIQFENHEQEGLFGLLTIYDNEWHYTLADIACQNLPSNEICTDPFVITSLNHESFHLVISITGTEHHPILFGHLTGKTVQADTNKLSGYAEDFRTAENIEFDFPDCQIEGKYGAFTMQNNAWTYTLNPYLLIHLAHGDIRYDPIMLIANDHSTHAAFISIIGTMEEPVLHIQTTNDQHLEPSTQSVTGCFNLQFEPSNESPFHSRIIKGQYGDLLIWGNHWAYHLNPKLSVDSDLTEQFKLTDLAIDHHSSVQLEFNIQHKAQAPEIQCLPNDVAQIYCHQILNYGRLQVLSQVIPFTPNHTSRQFDSAASNTSMPSHSIVLENQQSRSQYGEFTFSDQIWIYQIHPELTNVLEVGMTIYDHFTLYDQTNSEYKVKFQIISTVKGIEVIPQFGNNLLSLPPSQDQILALTPSVNDSSIKYPTIESNQDIPFLPTKQILNQNQNQNQANTDALVSQTKSQQTSTILIEKIQYPSVSGRIQISNCNTESEINMPDAQIEGKYGQFTIRNMQWIYTFSPDKVLPYSAETREIIDIYDNLNHQHHVIITIESGMKKPIITDILMTQTSHSTQSK